MDDLDETETFATGAKGIALELFGDTSEPSKRKVYHWIEKGRLKSVFRVGGELVAGKRALRREMRELANACINEEAS
jgi:hypothetical protein